jgi:hypothetical protein
LLAVSVLAGCRSAPAPPLPVTPPECPVIEIPLSGAVAAPDSEVSGLAWYGDSLVLLPQYPGRLGGFLFALSEDHILSFLDGELNGAVTPREVPLVAPDIESRVEGFEGFEAIAFAGDRVFVTVESQQGNSMMGYLIAGSVTPGLSEVRLDTTNLVQVEPQAGTPNLTDETLLIVDDLLVTIYESNGANVNPEPVAHLFDMDLTCLDTIPFPNVEYRITDATATDGEGRFWAINYLYPGDIDQLDPAPDPLVETYGAGSTHAGSETVERLLELQIGEEGVAFTGTPPLQFALASDGSSRNWEGLVRLDERGFLLATDKFPQTILAFVAAP